MNDNLDDRLDLAIDQDAEPVDLDQVLARFLLSFVRSSAESAAAEPIVNHNNSAGKKGLFYVQKKNESSTAGK